MLFVSFSHFLCNFSDRSAYSSFGAGGIKIKLADSPMFLFSFIIVSKFPIFEDSLGDLHAIEQTSFSIGLIDKPVSLVEGAIDPKHLPTPMSQIGVVVSLINISIVPCVYPIALLSIL